MKYLIKILINLISLKKLDSYVKIFLFNNNIKNAVTV